MQNVVGVRFKKAGKIYYFDPDQLQLEPGDGVIVETARGVEFGYLVVGPKMVADEEIITPLKKVIRKADDSDYRKLEENERKASEAFKIGQEKIAKHKLPMKLVNVEQTFDNKKIIFYFTAEGRVDFRELVKDLAAVFRMRIELRQIGVRDEAKMIGGLGLCGRSICCHSFLGEFEPVSIRMAKDQNLSLNPTKISGLCGRLMCCLQFEANTYKDALEQLPNPGDELETPQGKGRVTEVNPLTGEVNVQIDEGVEVVLNYGDDAPNCDACSRCCSVRQQVNNDQCPQNIEDTFLPNELKVEPEKVNKDKNVAEEKPAHTEENKKEQKNKDRNRKRRRRRKPKKTQEQGKEKQQNKTNTNTGGQRRRPKPQKSEQKS